MSKRLVMGLLLSVLVLAPPARQEALARSIPAYAGKARLGQDRTCFVREGPHGIMSRCTEDFIVPLTVDGAGTKTLTFSGRATTSGAQCRAVANDPFGTAYSASDFRTIPIDNNLVSRTTGAVTVPSAGVFFADCSMNENSVLSAFDYAR